MIHKKYIFFFLLTVSFIPLTWAQNDTVVLREIPVVDQRLRPSPGVDSYDLNLKELVIPGRELSRILSDQTPIFIKDYGPGQIATSGVRGTSAQHTDVLWNGIGINSPGLGQTNFSILPVTGFGSGQIIIGNGSVFNSSGGFGGSLLLQTPSNLSYSISGWLSASGGSFGTFRGEGEVQWKGFRIYGQEYSSDNDYSFLNYTLEGVPEQKLQNASFRGRNWMVDGGIDLGAGKLNIHAWYQDQNQDLPAPISAFLDNDRIEKMRQTSVRSSLEYLLPVSYGGWIFRMAGMKNSTHYSTNVIDSKTDFNTTLSQVVFRTRLFGFNLQAGGEIRQDRWQQESISQWTWNSYLNGVWKKNSVELSGMARAIGNNQYSGIQGSLGATVDLFEDFFLSIDLARNLRLPTLNDLYYPLGGNPDLQPEKGYSMEGGIG
ncbi:MAG: hypothetical protein LPK47_07790, partial [Bacteroidota bacterium]|nr:hypothetical protein [Bacteroidota bacterium]